MGNGLSMVGGGLMSFMHSWFVEQPCHMPMSSWVTFLGWIMLIVVISNIICYTLYAELLKKYTATFLAFTGLTGPLFAAFYDWILFGIGVSRNFYVATALITFGLYLFYKEELKQGPILKNP
jgi:drug/metabolite transporter (DMT)-like permease